MASFCLGQHPSMDFGLDGQLWKTMGNPFIIKGITPGTHLFYWRHSEDSLITTGKFYELRDGDQCVLGVGCTRRKIQ